MPGINNNTATVLSAADAYAARVTSALLQIDQVADMALAKPTITSAQVTNLDSLRTELNSIKAILAGVDEDGDPTDFIANLEQVTSWAKTNAGILSDMPVATILQTGFMSAAQVTQLNALINNTPASTLDNPSTTVPASTKAVADALANLDSVVRTITAAYTIGGTVSDKTLSIPLIGKVAQVNDVLTTNTGDLLSVTAVTSENLVSVDTTMALGNYSGSITRTILDGDVVVLAPLDAGGSIVVSRTPAPTTAAGIDMSMILLDGTLGISKVPVNSVNTHDISDITSPQVTGYHKYNELTVYCFGSANVPRVFKDDGSTVDIVGFSGKDIARFVFNTYIGIFWAEQVDGLILTGNFSSAGVVSNILERPELDGTHVFYIADDPWVQQYKYDAANDYTVVSIHEIYTGTPWTVHGYDELFVDMHIPGEITNIVQISPGFFMVLNSGVADIWENDSLFIYEYVQGSTEPKLIAGSTTLFYWAVDDVNSSISNVVIGHGQYAQGGGRFIAGAAVNQNSGELAVTGLVFDRVAVKSDIELLANINDIWQLQSRVQSLESATSTSGSSILTSIDGDLILTETSPFLASLSGVGVMSTVGDIVIAPGGELLTVTEVVSADAIRVTGSIVTGTYTGTTSRQINAGDTVTVLNHDGSVVAVTRRPSRQQQEWIEHTLTANDEVITIDPCFDVDVYLNLYIQHQLTLVKNVNDNIISVMIPGSLDGEQVLIKRRFMEL